MRKTRDNFLEKKPPYGAKRAQNWKEKISMWIIEGKLAGKSVRKTGKNYKKNTAVRENKERINRKKHGVKQGQK